jgi:hypothetical protein
MTPKVNYRQLKQAASETRHELLPYLSVSRADPARKIVSTVDGFDFTGDLSAPTAYRNFKEPAQRQRAIKASKVVCSGRVGKVRVRIRQEEGGASPAG